MLSTASTQDPQTSSVLDLAQKLATQQQAEKQVETQNLKTDPAPHPAQLSDNSLDRLFPYLQHTEEVLGSIQWDPLGVVIAPTTLFTPGMLANAFYFGHPRWGREYAEQAHRSQAFCDRWQAALQQHCPEGWDGKVVIDLGCGAGTLWERLGGEPAEIIGVDISLGALHWAAADGYAALRADVHQLPLQDQCADIVCANALLHHCDDPAQVLKEAARLVKPGGILITDMDPQHSAWQRKGWGLWLNQQSWPNLMNWLRDEIPQADQLVWQSATELHNRQPSQGLRSDLFHSTLPLLGFEVQVYPHHSNHHRGVGAEVFQGEWGKASPKIRWEQRLSGVDRRSSSSASTLLCIAKRPSVADVDVLEWVKSDPYDNLRSDLLPQAD